MRLSDLYRQLNTAERRALAGRANTSPAYLWQLANRWKGRTASVALINRLCEADARLTAGDLVAEFAKRTQPTDTDVA